MRCKPSCFTLKIMVQRMCKINCFLSLQFIVEKSTAAIKLNELHICGKEKLQGITACTVYMLTAQSVPKILSKGYSHLGVKYYICTLIFFPGQLFGYFVETEDLLLHLLVLQHYNIVQHCGPQNLICAFERIIIHMGCMDFCRK